MKKEFLSRSAMCVFYDISNQAFSDALRAGHPQPVKGRGFDKEAGARWFAARPGNGKAKKNSLAYLGTIPTTQASAPKLRAGKRGIEAGVGRLRTAEESLHRIWLSAVADREATAQTHFRNWQEALDLLTKAEQGLLKFKKETGSLTDTSKFKTLIKRNVEAAKSILLDIPGRVAPQCEGIPWHQVQKLLESEIRRALEKLTAV